MSATAYETSYPAYPRSSFQPSMAALGPSHLSPLFDVSPLLYPPTPLRDVSSSSSTTFLPNDATQQQQQHQQHQQQRLASSTAHSHQQQQQPNISSFFSNLTSATAPQSPLSIHHIPNPQMSANPTHSAYFDYTSGDPANRTDTLSMSHLHHRILQQQLQAKAAVMVPASPISVQSDLNSVSGGSAHDLFPTSDNASATSHSPQHLSSVSSSMSTPPPLQTSALPLPAHNHPHSHSQQPIAQPRLPAQAGGQLTDGKKRKGALSRKIACNVCHLAKTSCDGARPCSRCVRLMKTAQCVDRPSKMAKNRAVQPVASEETNAAAAAAVCAARAAAATSSAPPPVDAASDTTSRAAAASAEQQPNTSSFHQPRRHVATANGDVDIEDANDESDRSFPHSHSRSHSHSADECCDEGAASDHSSCASSADDDGSDSSDSSDVPSSPRMEAHISRSLLRAHISWINKQHGDTSTHPTAKMDLREKLLYFSWICHLMLSEDVEQIIHYSEVYHREHDHDNNKNNSQDCSPDVALKRMLRHHDHGRSVPKMRHPLPPPSTSRAFQRRRRQPYQPCDGTVCNNFCPTARAWSAANPVLFTWHQSPEQAVSEGLSNTYAVLVCRNNLQDAAESERQTRRIVATTLMLREREKEKDRLKLAAARRTADTIHISPIVEEAGPAAAAASSSTWRQSCSPHPSQAVVDDMGSFDMLVNHCGGMSPHDIDHFHKVRQSQQEEQQQEHRQTTDATHAATTTTPSFSAVIIREAERSSITPLAQNFNETTPSASSSSSSSSLPPAPPIEVPMSVHVNPAFERLFGHSQAELRQHLIRDGGRALYTLTQQSDWEKLMELDQEATWGSVHEYRTYAVIVNKWGGRVRCLVHTVYELNNDGKWKQSTTSFIPLPEEDNKPSSSNSSRSSSRQARDGHRRSGGVGDVEREKDRRRRRKDANEKGSRSGEGGKDRRRRRDDGKRS